MQAQQDSVTAELPGKPFFLKQAWTIGGEGNWDYMAMDSAALKLYVAHGTAVQVVDVSTGSLAGEISGMAEAHGHCPGRQWRIRLRERRTGQPGQGLRPPVAQRHRQPANRPQSARHRL